MDDDAREKPAEDDDTIETDPPTDGDGSDAGTAPTGGKAEAGDDGDDDTVEEPNSEESEAEEEPDSDEESGDDTEAEATGDPFAAAPDAVTVAAGAGRLDSSVTTALLSSFLTGAGHWVVRRFRRGLWFFLPVGIIVAGGLLFAASQGRTELAVKSVKLPWLWLFLIINLVVLAVRLAATADAWRIGRPSARRWPGIVGLIVAILLTAGPHLFVASRNLDWISTLESVFDSPNPSVVTDPGAYAGPVLSSTTTSTATLPPSTSTTETSAGTVSETTLPEYWGSVPPFTLPSNYLTSLEYLPLEGLADGRYLSVLLAGGDAGPGRGGLRTDTMIVATFDLELGRAYLFGISRELVHIPVPSTFRKGFYDLEERLWEQELKEWIWDQDRRCRRGGEWKEDPPDFCPEVPELERCDCFPDRLNAIYTYTRNWTRTWPDSPDPGMEALRQTMSTLLGIPIDYYVLVDMAGFVSLVNALGGVDIWVYESVNEGFSPAVPGGPIVEVNVRPGYRHLNGNQALAYVRDRSKSGDSGRIRRQRCMIRSVAAAADPLDLVWNFPRIAEAIRNNTTTNMPLDFLPELVRAAADLNLDEIVTVSLTGSYYYNDTDYRGIPKPNLSNIRWRVRSVLEGTAEGSSEGDTNECGDPNAGGG